MAEGALKFGLNEAMVENGNKSYNSNIRHG